MTAFASYLISRARAFWQLLIRLARGRGASPTILLLSFFDSFLIVPPVEVPLAAFSAALPHTWWRWALLATIGSTLGALVGYGIGFFFFDTFGAAILRTFGFTSVFADAERIFEDSTFVAMLLAGFTPLPFIPFTYAGGFFSVGLVPFMFGVVISRGLRYMLIAYAARFLGTPFLAVVLRAAKSGTAFTVVILLSFFLVLYFFAMHVTDF